MRLPTLSPATMYGGGGECGSRGRVQLTLGNNSGALVWGSCAGLLCGALVWGSCLKLFNSTERHVVSCSKMAHRHTNVSTQAERIATQSVARFVTEVVQLVAYALTGFLLPLGIAETLLFLRYSRCE